MLYQPPLKNLWPLLQRASGADAKFSERYLSEADLLWALEKSDKAQEGP